MKAKTKTGASLLFTDYWDFNRRMIINFNDKSVFEEFYQVDNHLIIVTLIGNIDIVFTGETPTLEFESYDKDQLTLKVV